MPGVTMRRDLLTVRVEADLKRQYQQVAELMGTTASDAIRRHMQETVQRFLNASAPKAAPQPAKTPVRPPAKPGKRKRR